MRMMKKILAALLACLMVFTVAGAFAEHYKLQEDFTNFDVELDIPEGATYEQNPEEEMLCLQFWFEDGSKPSFDLNVAPSDIVDGLSLGDFSQEDKDSMVSMASEGYSVPTNEFFVTPSGNTILLTQETDAAAGYSALMTTVYKGFFVNLYMGYEDGSPLTEDDMKLMHQVIESTWIVGDGVSAELAK